MPTIIDGGSRAGQGSGGSASDHRTVYFSEILGQPICARKVSQRIGKLSDLVFNLTDPYPEAVGIFVDHGWGEKSELIPWEKVIKLDEDAIFAEPQEGGGPYPPFVDQPGWLLVNEHLMGRTIFDIDGRRIEVVNDVQMLVFRGRMVISQVDTSFNGFLRKWGLGFLALGKDRPISWKYVQPLSMEDVGATDSVTLSLTRKQIREVPGEDLADALEMLSGKEQEAIFSALDSEKAAEALVEAEPRAQRQLIAGIHRDRARSILAEMSAPQLAALFSVLPHDDTKELMEILPRHVAERVRQIVSLREATAAALMTTDFVAVSKAQTVSQVLDSLRASRPNIDALSYLYVVDEGNVLAGVVDLRKVILAGEGERMETLMSSPVVSAEADDAQEDLAAMFVKYHFRLIPVVDSGDHLLGVVHHQDIMKATTLVATARFLFPAEEEGS